VHEPIPLLRLAVLRWGDNCGRQFSLRRDGSVGRQTSITMASSGSSEGRIRDRLHHPVLTQRLARAACRGNDGSGPSMRKRQLA
jgi:hypothetical protein